LQRKNWKNFPAIQDITAVQQKNFSQIAKKEVKNFAKRRQITKNGNIEGQKTQQSVPVAFATVP